MRLVTVFAECIFICLNTPAHHLISHLHQNWTTHHFPTITSALDYLKNNQSGIKLIFLDESFIQAKNIVKLSEIKRFQFISEFFILLKGKKEPEIKSNLSFYITHYFQNPIKPDEVIKKVKILLNTIKMLRAVKTSRNQSLLNRLSEIQKRNVEYS